MHYRGFRVASRGPLEPRSFRFRLRRAVEFRPRSNLRLWRMVAGRRRAIPVGSDSCESRPRSPPVNIPYEFFLVAP